MRLGPLGLSLLTSPSFADTHTQRKVRTMQELTMYSTDELRTALWELETAPYVAMIGDDRIKHRAIVRELIKRQVETPPAPEPEPVEESLDDEARAVKEFAENVLGMSPEPWQLSMMAAGAGHNNLSIKYRRGSLPVIPHFYRRAWTAYEQAEYDLTVTHGTKGISMSLRRTMGDDRPMSYSLTPEAARELAADLIARSDRIEGKA